MKKLKKKFIINFVNLIHLSNPNLSSTSTISSTNFHKPYLFRPENKKRKQWMDNSFIYSMFCRSPNNRSNISISLLYV